MRGAHSTQLTATQRRYLRAFDRHLAAPSARERTAARALMRELLDDMLVEAHDEPRRGDQAPG